MDMNLSKLQQIVEEDREAWHAAIHEVTKSRTQPSERPRNNNRSLVYHKRLGNKRCSSGFLIILLVFKHNTRDIHFSFLPQCMCLSRLCIFLSSTVIRVPSSSLFRISRANSFFRVQCLNMKYAIKQPKLNISLFLGNVK